MIPAFTAPSTTVIPGPEANAYFAVMTSTNQGLRDDLALLINTLVSDGLWAKLDLICVPQLLEVDSLRDLKINQNSVNVNGCAFVADQGFTVLSAGSKYVNTQFIPGGAAQAQLDDASLFCYTRTTNNPGNSTMMGSTPASAGITTQVQWVSSNTTYVSIINSFGGAISSIYKPSRTHGFFCATRTTPSVQAMHVNGTTKSGAITSGADIANKDIYVGCINTQPSAPANFYNNNQFSCWGVGAGLVHLEMVDLYNAIQTYMAARGTSVSG